MTLDSPKPAFIMMMRMNCHSQQLAAAGWLSHTLQPQTALIGAVSETSLARLDSMLSSTSRRKGSKPAMCRFRFSPLQWLPRPSPCPWHCAREAPVSHAEDVKRDGSSRVSGCGMALTQPPAATTPSRGLQHVYRAPLKCICGLGTRVGSIQ